MIYAVAWLFPARGRRRRGYQTLGRTKGDYIPEDFRTCGSPDAAALLALALVRSLPAKLHITANDACRLLKRTPGAGEATTVSIGDLVRIDTGKALSGVRRRMALYERAREYIVSDPTVMGGTPTIRGTRITARSVLGRIEAGDTIDSILEDYPYLDRETVEGAVVYAEANPPRGRPPGKPWRRAS
jgi:uncharacterized protein (DUF433 family)